MPYDCIKDTSKIAHSIIHEHEYTHTYIYIHIHCKTQYLIFESEGHTHIRNSQPYQLHASTHVLSHRSSIFQQVKKVQLIKFNLTDKIPTYEHLYSDQYYHIKSIANPHIEK